MLVSNLYGAVWRIQSETLNKHFLLFWKVWILINFETSKSLAKLRSWWIIMILRADREFFILVFIQKYLQQSIRKGSPNLDQGYRIRRVYSNLHPRKFIQCNIFSTETVVYIMAKRPLLYSLFGSAQITFIISFIIRWTCPFIPHFLSKYCCIKYCQQH